MVKSKIGKIFKLNQAQRRAVEAIEGPVIVIAGPGTGKTQTLTARIANILTETDTPPDSILALTFTDAGARQMRERLAKAIGRAAYYVSIQTFHSFSSDIIKSHPDVFVFAKTAEPLSDLERISIFRRILDSGKYRELRPAGAPYLYVASLVGAVSDLKREGIDDKELSKLFEKEKPSGLQAEKYHRRNLELIKIYRAYQKELKSRGRYDFEDMINLVVAAFKSNHELLQLYQQRYLYFLVDEFQDTNSAQNELLMLLASYWGKQANLFVVGDDEQSIYRFQGAAMENILGFKEIFEDADLVPLTENYRSTQTILDASRSVIANNKVSLQAKWEKIDKQLIARTADKKQEKIQVGRFSSGESEAFFIAGKIKELIKAGVKPSEIAVIYRYNSDGEEIAEMLSRMGIGFDIEGGKDILTDPDMEKLFLLMKAVFGVRTNHEGVDLFTLLNYPFIKSNYVDVLKLSRFASKRKLSLWEAINHPDLEREDLSDYSSLARVYNLLAELQQDESNDTFMGFFEKLINKTGYLDWCLRAPDAIDKLNKLNSLFLEIKRLNSADHELELGSFLETIDLMLDQKVAIGEKDLDIRTEAVSLMTAHRAKGREFEVVFMMKVIDGRWGNNKIRELIKLPEGILSYSDAGKKEKNEDERRLFYVAMTRAKRNLYITASETYHTLSGRRENAESMFILEIPLKYQQKIAVTKYESGVEEILKTLLKPIQNDSSSIEESDFLNKVLGDFKLSPTALNTYLACPYRFKLNNLMRAPRAKSSSLSFGTAVHEALEKFFRKYKQTGTVPGVGLLKKSFEDALEREILPPAEELALMKKGQEVLADYFNFYRNKMVVPFDIERFFGYGWSKVYLGSIPLGGKVDKIEPVNSRTESGGRRVRVVDYKTGRPKSRGEIEGKTKYFNGDYKRQLVFYRLLADLDEHFKEAVTEAELDFVEADKRTKKYRREQFVISEDEVSELKKVIRKAWNEMRELKFPRTGDVSRYCLRCQWRRHCWPDGVEVKREQLTLLDKV